MNRRTNILLIEHPSRARVLSPAIYFCLTIEADFFWNEIEPWSWETIENFHESDSVS